MDSSLYRVHDDNTNISLYVSNDNILTLLDIYTIAIHKIIQALDTSDIIVVRGGKNAEYRSTRINSKGI